EFVSSGRELERGHWNKPENGGRFIVFLNRNRSSEVVSCRRWFEFASSLLPPAERCTHHRQRQCNPRTVNLKRGICDNCLPSSLIYTRKDNTNFRTQTGRFRHKYIVSYRYANIRTTKFRIDKRQGRKKQRNYRHAQRDPIDL